MASTSPNHGNLSSSSGHQPISLKPSLTLHGLCASYPKLHLTAHMHP
jgi:hypothetical protein